MDLNLQETELYSNFDFGIENGSLIADSDYIWCVNGKDGSLVIKNVQNKNETSLPYHQFGIGSSEKFRIVAGKDFEYNQQKYLLVSLEIEQSNQSKRHQLVIFKLSVSRVICAFEINQKIHKIEILVKSRHFIDNNKNPTFFGNFSVSAVCGCIGGAVNIFDVTPSEKLLSFRSNEHSPIGVYWHTKSDLTDYDDIQLQKKIAHENAKIFGLTLNKKFLSENYFRYSLPNDQVKASIPCEYVKITSLKYEKNIDSLLIGFNFGCFQIWNMKTITIETSSGYGENNKPIIGFSLMQPQNDPKKCVYLMVAHSTAIIANEDKSKAFKNCRKPSPTKKNSPSRSKSFAGFNYYNNSNKNESSNLSDNSLDNRSYNGESRESDNGEFEIDNDDDDEADSSFVLLYQLMFEKCVNIYLNQNQFYSLYEGLNFSAIAFEHEFTFETLKCVKTNYSNEFNSDFMQNEDTDSSHSKIISIQTLNIINNRLQTDLCCIVWVLMDKNSPNSSCFYYLSVFNLNNWYMQLMPSKMYPLSETDADGRERLRKNIYFTNYTLSINSDLDCVKCIQIIDSKIKKIKNQNALSYENNIRNVLRSAAKSEVKSLADESMGNSSSDEYETEDEESDQMKNMGFDSNLADDTYLSMYFDLVVMSAFSLLKISIKPIEQMIHDLISKQEDLIHFPDKVYYLLSRFHLLDRYLTPKSQSQPKFIPIFNYLLETCQIYPIIKSLWKLKNEDTCVLSDYSLKAVLDWSWSKIVKIKRETNILYKLISIQTHNYLNDFMQYGQEIHAEHLHELFQRHNNLLESLIQIYKQFFKMATTQEGHLQLNKKLCAIECLKCYIEHLSLFHKFDLLLPPTLSALSREANDENSHYENAASSNILIKNKNYIKETSINFRLITNRWTKRRQDIRELNEQASDNLTASSSDRKYPFTYMIDCIIEECKQYANTSKFFTEYNKTKANNDLGTNENYPPKSLNDLLEICLECNLSTKMKQIIILYVLCDLMHTELNPAIQNYILKLVNAYCSTTFTLMSTNLDKALSVPWSLSSSKASIISLGQEASDDPNQFSCLFDLVNGLYLVDCHFMERAFKYLRATDINYLEFYEKYFILYNSVCEKDYKIAAQYLWLFQKLNASSIGSSGDLNCVNQLKSENRNRANNTLNNDLTLFHFLTRSNSSSEIIGFNSQAFMNANKYSHEQRMHFRLIITIYLANSLVNEAYELIKPHLKHIKSSLSGSFSLANIRLSKELLVHFFVEAEKFKLWKKIVKLGSLDNDLLLILFNYLEAKQDLNSICMAIDLHINNRNYKHAIELYDRHSKQISNSAEFKFLASMIEIAKEMQTQYSRDEFDLSNKQLFTPIDLKENASFQYEFSIPLAELCKNSKRCLFVLKTNEDSDYINLLKLPSTSLPEYKISSTSHLNNSLNSANTPERTTRLRFGIQESTNLIQNLTPTETNLVSSIKKRKASTPHPIIKSPHRKSFMLNLNENIQADIVPASDSKVRVLSSSMRFATRENAACTNSGGSKSVKFKLTKYTRKITDENYEDNEEHFEVSDKEEESDYDDEKCSGGLVLEESCATFNQTPASPERKKLVFIEDDLLLENDNQQQKEKTHENSHDASYNNQNNDDILMDHEAPASIHETTVDKSQTKLSLALQLSTDDERKLTQEELVEEDVEEEKKESSSILSENNENSNKDSFSTDLISQEADRVRKSIDDLINNSAKSLRKSLGSRLNAQSYRHITFDLDSQIEREEGSASERSINAANDEKSSQKPMLKTSTNVDLDAVAAHTSLTDSELSPIHRSASNQQNDIDLKQNNESNNVQQDFKDENSCENKPAEKKKIQNNFEDEKEEEEEEETKNEENVVEQEIVQQQEEYETQNEADKEMEIESNKPLKDDLNYEKQEQEEQDVEMEQVESENGSQEEEKEEEEQQNEAKETEIQHQDAQDDRQVLVEEKKNVETRSPCHELIIAKTLADDDEKEEEEKMSSMHKTASPEAESNFDQNVYVQNEINEYKANENFNQSLRETNVENVENLQRENEEKESNETETTPSSLTHTLTAPTTQNEDSIDNMNVSLSQENNEESFDLNMSSISTKNYHSSQEKEHQSSQENENVFLLPSDAANSQKSIHNRMLRTNSELSLYSQISSVSEHYEKMRQKEKEDEREREEAENSHSETENDHKVDEYEENGEESAKKAPTRRASVKRRAPLTKQSNIVAPKISAEARRGHEQEEKTSQTSRAATTSLRRRNSDLSAASTSSTLTNASKISNKAAIDNAETKRQTRSKLRSMTSESISSQSLLPPKQASAARVTRRNSKKANLEQVEEETADSHKISKSNLKKHDAIMEQQEQEKRNKETESSNLLRPTLRSTRVTRSKTSTQTAQRSPSPSASSIVSSSSILSAQSNSTITSNALATKRKTTVTRTGSALTKKASKLEVEREEDAESHADLNEMQHDKTLKADDNDSCIAHNTRLRSRSRSPSVISVASSTASQTARVRRSTRKVNKDDLDANEKLETKASTLSRSNSARTYGLRKGKIAANNNTNANDEDDNDADETSSIASSVAELGPEETPRVARLRKTRSARVSSITSEHTKLDKIEENNEQLAAASTSKRVTRSKH